MKTCKHCGRVFDESDFEGIVVNAGMKEEFYLCDECASVACNNGYVVSCESCGAYFSNSNEILPTEEIYGCSFTPCPACKKDIVDCTTRDEFMKDHEPYRYAVIVQFAYGTRGYIISVNVGENRTETIFKKLADKVDLRGMTGLSVAEILSSNDEF